MRHTPLVIAALAAGPGLPTWGGDLTLNVPVSGELSESSPQARWGRREDRWSLDLPSGELVRIVGTSPDFDPALVLYASGEQAGWGMRWEGSEETVLTLLPAEGMPIELGVQSIRESGAASAEAQLGRYSLVARAVSTEPLALGEVIEADDTRGELFLRVAVEAGEVVEVVASAESTNPCLDVYGPAFERISNTMAERIGGSMVTRAILRSDRSGDAIVHVWPPEGRVVANTVAIPELDMSRPWQASTAGGAVRRVVPLAANEGVILTLAGGGPWSSLEVLGPDGRVTEARALPIQRPLQTGTGGMTGGAAMLTVRSQAAGGTFTLWATPIGASEEPVDPVNLDFTSTPVSRELDAETGTAKLWIQGRPGQDYELRLTSSDFPLLVAVDDESRMVIDTASDEGFVMHLPIYETPAGAMLVPVHSRDPERGGTFFVSGHPIDPPHCPPIALRTPDGEEFDAATLEGKTLMINFWGTWCGPCVAELPLLVAAQTEYGPRGLQIIGIADDDTSEDVRRVMAEQGINYPVLMDDEATSQAFGRLLPAGMITMHPTTFFMAPDGRVLDVVEGSFSANGLRSTLERVLDEASAATE